jgi:hypothetical protein
MRDAMGARRFRPTPHGLKAAASRPGWRMRMLELADSTWSVAEETARMKTLIETPASDDVPTEVQSSRTRESRGS